MSKKKPRVTTQVFVNPASTATTTCVYTQVDYLITLFGYTDANGMLHSMINFLSSDKDGLQGLELVFRKAMSKAIQQYDLVQFRKTYVALERIMGIDMEKYVRLELHFPSAGKTVHVSPSELCGAFKAWPIVVEVFKLGMAHNGPIIRENIDSPSQIIYRLGNWLVDPVFKSEITRITQITHEVVSIFLAELKPFAQAKEWDLKSIIQGIPFLKQFPPLEKIFWTQYAALSK